MSSATSAYAESVASCRPSTPLLRSPPPAGDTLPRLPDRRRLDFPTGGGLDDEDDDEFLCRAAEEMERSHYEVKRRAAQGQAPAAARLPHRRRLDFSTGGGLDDEDDDDFLCRAAEEMERNHYEVKRRGAQGQAAPAPAPPALREKQCICGRGPCDVVWKERGGWAYVCSAPPKCTHFAWCEESDLNPNSQPALRNHPEPSNPRVSTTPVNVSPQGVGATTPVNVNPHGAGATTPVNVSPQGAGATIPVNVSPQGARSNGNLPTPICKCTAGKCRKLTIKGVDYYVCPIPKGQGACPYRVLVNAAAEELLQIGNNNLRENDHLEYNAFKKEANEHNMVNMGENNENGTVNPDQPEDDEWPFDIVDDNIVPNGRLALAHPTPLAVVAWESPSMLHKQFSLMELETPTKSPMPPTGTISPITQLNNCFRCGEGHWYKNCPKPPRPCYRCGEVGHRFRDCPKFSPQPDTCFHCGEVGHWKIYCPVLRDSKEF